MGIERRQCVDGKRFDRRQQDRRLTERRSGLGWRLDPQGRRTEERRAENRRLSS